ncbi:ABC transporter substrate-binding protein [Moritella sp. Urea-trap-13]|uniref:ABC transporter substrate-binding protein n=1 Tax=Moritella sp. Urea-trap-13 TaxID=2058327 RepID=UPI000C328AEB|nr:ABC transporter substrate-binding protein [Moritella sp. Urea-trap-13]PKH09297.1 ABC transporter substrate-binding protein [Moritella sp. Urea-trap-13]
MPWASFKHIFYTLILFISFPSLANTSYPLTVLDGLGHAIVIEKQPQRISSKTLFSDAVLLDLVDETALSSLTDLAINPNYSLIIDRLPESMPLLGLNIEMIIANRPDIVFAANWSDPAKLSILENVGITVFRLQAPKNIDEIETEILRVGMIVNKSDEAQQIISTMRLRLKADIIPAKHQFTGMDYNPWGTSSGRDSSWNGLLEQANVVNIIKDYTTDKYGQVPISKEMIITLNPEVLFIPAWVYGDENTAEQFKLQVLSDPSLQSVSAIKNNRIYQVPHALRGVYSQYYVDAIRFINHSVYKK